MAERESLERDEQEQLTEVIKASLADVCKANSSIDSTIYAQALLRRFFQCSMKAHSPCILSRAAMHGNFHGLFISNGEGETASHLLCANFFRSSEGSLIQDLVDFAVSSFSLSFCRTVAKLPLDSFFVSYSNP